MDSDEWGGGAAIACALLSGVAGIFGAVLVYLVGGSLLDMAAAYVCVGLISFAGSLGLYLLVESGGGKSDLDQFAVIRPVAAAKAMEVLSETLPRPAQWMQRVPIGDELSDQRFFYVGDLGFHSGARELADFVASRGYGFDACDDLEAAVATIALDSKLWSTLVIDVDECQREVGLSEIVADLMLFRYSAPEVVVVLLSADFARDDGGTDRASVADYSLRAPVTPERIVSCLPFARENNTKWCRGVMSASRAEFGGH